MKKKPWRKNLYEKQDYPDNYTDESFLKDLRVNVHFTPVSLKDSVFGATLIVHELCTVIVFVNLYVYLYNEWTEPNTIFLCTCSVALLGFVFYRSRFGSIHTFGYDLQTLLLFLVFGQLFSPILYTLTDTISTDTIHKMSFLMMFVHLIFFDYGLSVAIVSNSISISAAIFASVCLSSRLASPYHAFILMTVSIKCFVLFPLLRNKIKTTFLTTLIFVILVAYFLATISILMTYVFLAIIMLLNVICPLLFIRFQKYKDNIYGPWDEAIVQSIDINE